MRTSRVVLAEQPHGESKELALAQSPRLVLVVQGESRVRLLQSRVDANTTERIVYLTRGNGGRYMGRYTGRCMGDAGEMQGRCRGDAMEM